MFVDHNDYEEERAYVGEELVFDGTDEGDVELFEGDTGPAIVVRCLRLTPHANRDEWLRNNIFQSISIIQKKVYRFVIDASSCENIMSTEVVEKLGINTEAHPKPYKLVWLKKG